MALRCLFDYLPGRYNKLLRRTNVMANETMRFIYSRQQADGGYGTVYTTALALHADLNRKAAGVMDNRTDLFDVEAARRWLINTQKEV